MEFKPFPSIERIDKIQMHITQKCHGSNSSVFIFEENIDGLCEKKILVGSRTRWITPGKNTDNYGFAAFVLSNKQEFIEKLGVGTHFGEWCGPGINSGEGLSERTFVLFDWWKFPEGRPLPPQTKVVPVLYNGKLDIQVIDEVMNELKTNGSKLVPGFSRPEGVVVSINGNRYKKVFDAEETAWKKGDENYQKKKRETGPNFDHLMQPIRLEKLLSRDSQYTEQYPSNLATIVDDYIADLIKEDQILNPEVIKVQCRGQVFKFVRETMNK